MIRRPYLLFAILGVAVFLIYYVGQKRYVNTEVTVVADFENGKLPASRKDRDEDPAANSNIAMSITDDAVTGKALRVALDVVIHSNPRHGNFQWAYFYFSMPERDVSAHQTLSFRMRKIKGNIPNLIVQFQQGTNPYRNQKIIVTPQLAQLSDDWLEIRVDMTQIRPLALLKDVEYLLFFFTSGSGIYEFDQVVTRRTSDDSTLSGLDKAFPGRRRKWKTGTGLGSVGDDVAGVRRVVKEFNRKVSGRQKITYVSQSIGTVNFSATPAVLSWYPDTARQLAKTLGDGINVVPIIEGQSGGVDLLGEVELTSLANDIADSLSSEALFKSVLFNFEPHHPNIDRLFQLVRERCTNAIGTVQIYDDYTPATFRSVDVIGLQAYNLCPKGPEQYREAVRDVVYRFLSDATTYDCPAMVVVPAIAAMESEGILAADGSQKPNGYKMSDFTEIALEAVDDFTRNGDTTFVGIGVFTYLSEEIAKSLGEGPYPRRISNVVWELLSSPLQWHLAESTGI